LTFKNITSWIDLSLNSFYQQYVNIVYYIKYSPFPILTLGFIKFFSFNCHVKTIYWKVVSHFSTFTFSINFFPLKWYPKLLFHATHYMWFSICGSDDHQVYWRIITPWFNPQIDNKMFNPLSHIRYLFSSSIHTHNCFLQATKMPCENLMKKLKDYKNNI